MTGSGRHISRLILRDYCRTALLIEFDAQNAVDAVAYRLNVGDKHHLGETIGEPA